MADYKALLLNAAEVRNNAYCPYSRFSVGAALLGESGAVYLGCNLENAALSVICAERGALAQAVADGERRFLAIAITGGVEGTGAAAPCFPCGVCRQMLYEFGGGELDVIVGTPEDYRVYPLRDLLPHAFGPELLKEGG